MRKRRSEGEEIGGLHTYIHTHTHIGDTVSRFNIYGLKYSRNHTGGGECTGMTCPGGGGGGARVHSDDASRRGRAAGSRENYIHQETSAS